MVPLEGCLILLVVKFGLALDVGDMDVALVFYFVPVLLRFQIR